MDENMIPLLYKDRREEGETPLRQCQLVQLHLLYVFDAICKKHGLKYFLGGGTLLGAMRHNGFIPWDDDLDVGMTRRDYRKFLKVARADLPKDVIMQTSADVPERIMSFAKLRDAYSFHCEKCMGVLLSRANGIFIDIFPYDEVPSIGDWLERRLVYLINCSWKGMRGFRGYGRRGWWQAFIGPLMAVICGAVNLLLHGIRHVLLPFFRCKNLYLDVNFGFVVPYRKDAVFPLSEHVFEDGVFPVPNDPDVVLCAQYGDWHVMPPPEKRKFHSYLILPFQNTGSQGAMAYPAKAKVS